MTEEVTIGEHRPLLGPHRVPQIECERCGRGHHIDAAGGENVGHCVDCNAYLRRPTEWEEQQFAAFIEWNYLHRREGR